MFRNLWKKVIAWVLVFGWLLGGPVMGAEGRQVVGKVLLSSGASVEGVALPNEGTILADDLLTTEKGGKALLEYSRTGRAALGEETSVRFRSSADPLVARLSSGTLVAQKQDDEVLVIETPKYKIKPRGTGKAIYWVTMLADKSTIVAARYGEVSITEVSSGQSYLLPQGMFAAIPASASGVPASPEEEKEESRQAPGQQAPMAPGKPPEPPWHIASLSHGASLALVGGVGVFAVTLPLLLGGEAPVSPTR